jgi:hypothetical protein
MRRFEKGAIVMVPGVAQANPRPLAWGGFLTNAVTKQQANKVPAVAEKTLSRQTIARSRNARCAGPKQARASVANVRGCRAHRFPPARSVSIRRETPQAPPRRRLVRLGLGPVVRCATRKLLKKEQILSLFPLFSLGPRGPAASNRASLQSGCCSASSLGTIVPPPLGTKVLGTIDSWAV